MDIAVFGAGSLGSLIGGLLTGPHHVTLVSREAHANAMAANGLTITGNIDRHVFPAVATDWGAVGETDLAIVTVKSYDTESAARHLAARPPSTVLTVQNGLGTVATLQSILPPSVTVLAGTCTYGAKLAAPGVVTCTGVGSIVIGDPAGGRHLVADQVADALGDTPLQLRAVDDLPTRRWEKLAVNAAINPVTALARVPNGAILAEPLWSVANCAALETAHVARHHGVELSAETISDVLADVVRTTADNESSMARDVRRGRRTEVDAITGQVVARAPESAPVNELLYALLVGYEIGANVREPESR